MSRSVLLLDFDNVFSGLAKLDYSAALRFAEQPDVWLEALKGRYRRGGERRWLVLRCYMNPAGWSPAPTEQGRVFFSRFRPFFTSAGFEVVDCPTLTKGSKNAADIKMVIDALDALSSVATFDELVLGSADADFTPLLQRLRAHDKRTVLLTSGDAAAAVRASADLVLDEQDLMGLLERDAEDEDTLVAAPSPAPASDDLAQRFGAAVAAALAASATPLNLAALSNQLRAQLGNGQDGVEWPGGRGFTQAVRALQLAGAELTQHHLYDTRRHERPAGGGEQMSPLDRILKVVGWPRLAPETWPVVIEVLAEYAATHDFHLSESAKWSRDSLAERGHVASRTALGYLVRACAHGGANLASRPGVPEIREALLCCLEQRAEDTGLEVDEADRSDLGRLFGAGTASEV